METKKMITWVIGIVLGLSSIIGTTFVVDERYLHSDEMPNHIEATDAFFASMQESIKANTKMIRSKIARDELMWKQDDLWDLQQMLRSEGDPEQIIRLEKRIYQLEIDIKELGGRK